MRTTPEGDPYGVRTIAELADEVTDSPREAVFIGAVRNVVAPESSGYPWPTPSAFFGVWTVDTSPAVDGVWLPIGSDSSPLQQKHWYPIVSAD